MSVLVESQDSAMLYDTGPRYSAETDAGARVIAPYLRWRGIEHLDLLVVSHLDSDHSGGTASLLRNVRIDRVWTSIRADHPMLKEAKALQRCMEGQTLALGSMELRVLRPLPSDYDRAAMSTNAMSCVLEVRAGPHRVLLTGDLPARQEVELIERYSTPGAALVTAPHHGSRSSSSAPFVDATRPIWVVYQAGYRNRFGHPAEEVVARYAAVGSRSVRTDHAGAAQWRLRGDGSIAVESMRMRPRYWHNRPGKAEMTGEASEELSAYQVEPQVEPLQPF
jgi:competence protein ComEC